MTPTTSKGVRLALLLAIIAVAAFWASPYWAISGFAKAAQAGDADLLSDYIDLDRLKQSVKSQVMAHMQSELDAQEGGFAAIGAALGTIVIDKSVDQLITPELFAKMLKGNMQRLDDSRASVALRIAANPDADWLNDSTFRVRMHNDTSMTWRREGLSWRLTSVTVPLDKD